MIDGETTHVPKVEELDPLFPNYQITRLLAVGGMGAIFHAHQLHIGREVVIKILPAEFRSDEKLVHSFSNEAQAMAMMNQQNIVQIYDFGEVADMLYIIMEYVPGMSIYQYQTSNKLNIDLVLRMVLGLVHGIAHIHKNGIVHRDIKPGNILLDNDLNPKIADFGLARSREIKTSKTDAVLGTPGYVAPEVIHRELTSNHRADIYAAGVILHELLTGHPPKETFAPPSTIIQCDPKLDDIVRKATHPEVLSRYQKAEEFADDLLIVVGKSRTGRNADGSATTSLPPMDPQPEQTQAMNQNATVLKESDLGGKPKSKIGLILTLLLVFFIIGIGFGIYLGKSVF